MVHDTTLGAYLYVRSFLGCFHPYSQVPQAFQRRKKDANQEDFEIKLNLNWKIKFNQPPKQ